MKVKNLDHNVLTVQDIDVTCGFYEKVLEMELVVFGEGRKALKFGNKKINLHLLENEFEPKALKPTPGSMDLCLITETPMDMIIELLKDKNIPLIKEPVKRTGDLGEILSIYIRDPDLNLLEISNYD
jgi:catechol 2,3-dioxygenase-like lactoylglutathione lyase family enzyme